MTASVLVPGRAAPPQGRGRRHRPNVTAAAAAGGSPFIGNNAEVGPAMAHSPAAVCLSRGAGGGRWQPSHRFDYRAAAVPCASHARRDN